MLSWALERLRFNVHEQMYVKFMLNLFLLEVCYAEYEIGFKLYRYS